MCEQSVNASARICGIRQFEISLTNGLPPARGTFGAVPEKAGEVLRHKIPRQASASGIIELNEDRGIVL
jgi:hypothetical protein